MFTDIKFRPSSVIRNRRGRGRRSVISYANVTATMAIVLSMSGGALAANHYLLTSTKQISPRVLHKLRGRIGHTGPPGAMGPRGATGATGQNLTAETPLPSGHSESGFYAAAAGNATTDWIGTGITYVQPLSSALPNANIIWNKAGTTSTHCSGVGHADPGFLCLYDNEESGLSGSTAFYSTGFSPPSAGVILYWFINAPDNYVSGEYTVTAP